MTMDARLARLYQQMEPVRRAGDRGWGELCIMSSARESHFDIPVAISTLLRRFAVTINDEIPDHLRVSLLAFAT